MNLNERIAKIIEYSELTSSEFADSVDVQRSSISHITSGRNKPSLDFLVKVKDRFPELEWDWLIKGHGEMLKKSEEEMISEVSSEKSVPASLPDLFSLIDDENFGITESEDTIRKENFSEHNQTSRESFKPIQSPANDNLNDSQRLTSDLTENSTQITDNQEIKIKRIVLFYENGKFESFEP